MGRLMAIDYGTKRVGIAVTDPFQIIANGLTTVHSSEVFDFLKKYFLDEKVDCVVVGNPKRMNNEPSQSAPFVEQFIKEFKKHFPLMQLARADERFTSKIAQRTMFEGGLKKKDRQNKELVDEISAVLILQTYLDTIKNFNR